MTKDDLVARMASAAGISKAAAARSLSGFLSAVSGTLKKKQKVTLVGFGTFSVSRRKARKGRNPRTGQAITIPAANVPKFSAGQALKKAVR